MSRFFLNVVRRSLPRTPLPVLAIPALPPRANSATYEDWLERAVHVLRTLTEKIGVPLMRRFKL